MKPGRSRWLLGAGLVNLAFLYAPVLVLIVYSFNASRLSAGWQGWTLEWYRLLAHDEGLRLAAANSLAVASLSTVMATVLGLCGAIGLERSSFRGRPWLEGGLLLPLVIPEVMMGVSLMLFFMVVKLPLGRLTVTIGHAAFNLPIVLVILRARLRKLDPSLEEAARDLGATPWQTFRRVTLPLLTPAILGAALLAFAISLDDFIVTFFTAGPGSTTLPLYVYSMVKTGVTPVINALSTVLVLLSMALIAASLALQRRAAG